jgi:hypothetical protein
VPIPGGTAAAPAPGLNFSDYAIFSTEKVKANEIEGTVFTDANTHNDGVFLFPIAIGLVSGCQSDSGGPVFSGTTAYGLTGGRVVSANGCGLVTTIQPLQLAPTALNLTPL